MISVDPLGLVIKTNMHLEPRSVMEKTVKTYYEYLHLLETEVIKNDGKELSWNQIDRFITKYNLDKDWNITIADVSKDLKEYLQKWLVSILRRKLEWDQRKSYGMDTEQSEALLSREDRSISDRIKKAMQKQSGDSLDQKRMAAMVSESRFAFLYTLKKSCA